MIGSSFIGGVCNNSRGALIRRGPAFTEKSLFAQINVRGELELIDHLGIDLDKTPEEIFNSLEQQDYVLKPHVDGKKFKQDVLKYLDSRGAKYPAEHNVKHLYHVS